MFMIKNTKFNQIFFTARVGIFGQLFIVHQKCILFHFTIKQNLLCIFAFWIFKIWIASNYCLSTTNAKIYYITTKKLKFCCSKNCTELHCTISRPLYCLNIAFQLFIQSYWLEYSDKLSVNLMFKKIIYGMFDLYFMCIPKLFAKIQLNTVNSKSNMTHKYWISVIHSKLLIGIFW